MYPHLYKTMAVVLAVSVLSNSAPYTHDAVLHSYLGTRRINLLTDTGKTKTFGVGDFKCNVVLQQMKISTNCLTEENDKKKIIDI